MKFLRHILTLTVAAAGVLAAGAQQPEQWIHVYMMPDQNPDYKPENPYAGTGVFYSMPFSELDSIRFTTNTAGKFNRMRLYSEAHKYFIPMTNIRHWVISPNVATFNITTTLDPTLPEVESKKDYLDATLTIDGCGVEADFSGEMKIRGRGNSTWGYPKKAYRLKFPEKTKLCGFRKAKNYVLLANYIDPSMMRNEAACLATQYAGMPYPTHSKPVDVYFNGTLKGSYNLIEKVGFNNGSVDLPAEQEAQSIMFELDTNYDEELRQSSELFRLPVMLKDPDGPVDPVEAKIWFADWMADFNEMERAVHEGRNIGDYIDYTTLAKYLLVYNLAANQELNHPKSVYLYKTRGSKYFFGPCWDFDWAYGYQPTYRAIESQDGVDEETARKMLDEIHAYIKAQNLDVYVMFEYDNKAFIWFGDDSFMCRDANGDWNYNWPYGSVSYAPSYRNYLLGHGSNNQNTSEGMGNGGEFFMSIIMDNPEFMAEYKRVWEDFKSRLPEFWAEFDAYAKALAPSAARNSTVWNCPYMAASDAELYPELTAPDTAVEALRGWLERRIEFMDDETHNFGLYDPATDYVRGSIKGYAW